MVDTTIHLDCLIFGGGVAGLFALAQCVSKGHETLLLECNTLGAGQTIHSLGVIHGNSKESTPNNNLASNMTIRDMPLVWRRCLAGESTPDLRNVTLRSDYCHVWRTNSFMAKLRWLGLQQSPRLKLQELEEDERPPVFHGYKGRVARLNRQVIEPRSLLEVFSSHYATRILQTTQAGIETEQKDGVWLIRLLNPETGEPLDLCPRKIVLTAGIGNQALRSMFGLIGRTVKEYINHIVMVRGDLPIVNGFCTHGAHVQLMMTTTTDYARRHVWIIQCQLAKQHKLRTSDDLIQHTAAALRSVLPSIEIEKMKFATYETTRVGQGIQSSRNPTVSIQEEGDILICSPIEMSFAPLLANEIVKRLGTPRYTQIDVSKIHALATWPRPAVALPPWETDQPWTVVSDRE